MKKILIIITIQFLAIVVKAQIPIDTNAVVQLLNESEYIFEGRVINRCSYYDNSERTIYTNYQVEISKIFKGALSCGTVSILYPGGQTQNESLEFSHVDEFGVGFIGTFGCKNAQIINSSNCNASSNSQLLKPVRYVNGSIGYFDDPVNYIAEGYGFEISDINDLYNFLQIACGISYTNCNANLKIENWTNNKREKKKIRSTDPIVYSINGSTNSIYPTQAGNNDTLTFKGANFGMYGTIYLPNVEELGTSLYPLNESDIFSWNDSLIRIRVPHFTDSFDVINLSKVSLPGSGTFIIENDLGDISTDSLSATIINNLEIRYSLRQMRALNQKANRTLINEYAAPFLDSTYHFKLHSSITNPNMIACIKAAFRQWTCLTGVSFVLDGGSTNDTIASLDYKNIIQLKNYQDSLSEVAVAVSSAGFACQDISKIKATTSDIDIYINPTTLFWYDTINISNSDSIPALYEDFYYSFLHELGHAHNLGHVMDIKDLMYPISLSSTSPIACSNRRIILNNRHQKSGDLIMQMSSQIGGSCNLPAFSPIKYLDTTCRLEPMKINIVTMNRNSNMFIPYPNPNTSLIYISTSSNEIIEYKLFDMVGTLKKVGTTKNDKAIDLSNIMSGNYLLFINNSKFSECKLIQCQR
jgi:hypothetical protein